MSTDADELDDLDGLDELARAERHFGVEFPQDYREFMATRGRMDEFVPPAEDFLMLHSAAELVPLDEAGEFQSRFPGAVVIGGDGGRELLTYDFRRNPPRLALLDVSAPDWSSALHQADSLTEFLKRFPENGWSFEEEDS